LPAGTPKLQELAGELGTDPKMAEWRLGQWDIYRNLPAELQKAVVGRDMTMLRRDQTAATDSGRASLRFAVLQQTANADQTITTRDGLTP